MPPGARLSNTTAVDAGTPTSRPFYGTRRTRFVSPISGQRDGRERRETEHFLFLVRAFQQVKRDGGEAYQVSPHSRPETTVNGPLHLQKKQRTTLRIFGEATGMSTDDAVAAATPRNPLKTFINAWAEEDSSVRSPPACPRPFFRIAL